jgi:zinc protease
MKSTLMSERQRARDGLDPLRGRIARSGLLAVLVFLTGSLAPTEGNAQAGHGKVAFRPPPQAASAVPPPTAGLAPSAVPPPSAAVATPPPAVAPPVTRTAPPAGNPVAPKISVPPTPVKRDLGIRVQRERLENGLRIVLNEDHSSPTVSVAVTYDVGSRNEVPGRSGFAHLFEHMMFQGSRNVGKGDHFLHVSARGGSLNGTTSSDRTNYFELAPSSALSLLLWLEADRMETLAVTAENFENQRQVVQEEYRMRVSNAAYALGHTKMNELVFEGYFPYSHDPIGSMEDLDRAELAWIREFHAAYYAPNNAVLAISGDFHTKTAMGLVRQYFSDAKPVAVPPYTPPPVPEQVASRHAELTDPNAKTTGVYYGWLIPPSREPEHYALELASLVIAHGDSSTLHQKLVQGTGQLRDIASWTRDHRGPDSFVVRALLSEEAKLEDIEREIRAELDRLATEGPRPEELERAQQQLLSFFLFGLEGNQSRATQLGIFELFYGDANLLNQEVNHYFGVTPEAVKNAVARYLVPARTTRVVVHPETSTPAKSEEQ